MSVRSYSFTLNNYSEEEVTDIKEKLIPITKRFILGFEVGDQLTPHIQGCIVFSKRVTFNFVKDVFKGRAHVEKTKDIDASFTYCKKEGNYFLHGDEPKKASLDDFKNDVKNGIIDVATLREKHSMCFARYSRFCIDYINDNHPKIEKPIYPLRDWQINLNNILKREPDDRTIIFIVDYVGNTGKSWFCHYFSTLHSNVQIMSPGKRADLSYALKVDTKYIFFDCCRSKQQDFIQYDFLEDLKNGYVFSSKYESMYKRLNKVHVCVMMNEDPDRTKLSKDRYLIIHIK